MMFTTKTEYGLKALAALARSHGEKPLALSQIAKTEHISRAYLEQIFSKLKSNGLVKSTKGAEGGYILSRSAKKINLLEVIEALEGPLAVFYCMAREQSKAQCHSRHCLTRKVWDEVQRNIIRTLKKFKLSDLI